jgi:O-acetylhomoserine/O-acetylserine sulfhydrylase-like pyridoxal-dependent enzyme
MNGSPGKCGVKAYVRRGKNDAVDAAAICEAVGRPNMRFVPVKTEDQQAALMLHKARELLIRQQTMLVNAVRAHMAELGMIAPLGRGKVEPLIAVIVDDEDESVPALRISKWLQDRPEVRKVLHPALASCPGHEIWKRDFDGSSGLFSIVLEKLTRAQLECFLENLRLFKLGYGWGGFESLTLPIRPENERSVTQWREDGTVIRLNVGLENPNDLEADLDAAFARLNALN